MYLYPVIFSSSNIQYQFGEKAYFSFSNI